MKRGATDGRLELARGAEASHATKRPRGGVAPGRLTLGCFVVLAAACIAPGASAQTAASKDTVNEPGPPHVKGLKLGPQDIRGAFAEFQAAKKAKCEHEFAELHASRARRKRESVEELASEHRRLLGDRDYVEELRLHAERLARLRRIGNLVLCEMRDEDTRDRVLALVYREAERHQDALTRLEDGRQK